MRKLIPLLALMGCADTDVTGYVEIPQPDTLAACSVYFVTHRGDTVDVGRPDVPPQNVTGVISWFSSCARAARDTLAPAGGRP